MANDTKLYTGIRRAVIHKVDSRYRQIESSLRVEIERGRWPTGALMPSRRELAKEYGVSLITLERAIAGLLKDGVLLAKDRRGTYVADPLPATQAVSHTDMVQEDSVTAKSVGGGNTSKWVKTHSASAHSVGIVASLFVMDQSHLELNNFWVRMLVHSLEQELSRDGHSTEFFNRVQAPGKPLIPLKDAVDAVLSSGADAAAIIALGLDPDEVDNSLSSLDRHSMSVVCITSAELRRPVPCVTYDNRGAGYQAARHLLRNGGTEILFIAPFMAPWVNERLAGIEAAVAHMGLPIEAVHVYPQHSRPWGIQEDPVYQGYEAGKRALEAGVNSSRVVCANDGVAFGFLRAASERRMEAGRDFSIVSFDDHPEARSVGLTTLRPPMEAMGHAAARLLRAALSDNQPDTLVRLSWDLLPRSSTRLHHVKDERRPRASSHLDVVSHIT